METEGPEEGPGRPYVSLPGLAPSWLLHHHFSMVLLLGATWAFPAAT